MKSIARGIAVWVGYCAWSGRAWAQEDPAEERAQSFVAVEGPQVEDVPGGLLLVAAYFLVWALLFGYLYLTSVRARKLELRLRALEAGGAAEESP